MLSLKKPPSTSTSSLRPDLTSQAEISKRLGLGGMLAPMPAAEPDDITNPAGSSAVPPAVTARSVNGDAAQEQSSAASSKAEQATAQRTAQRDAESTAQSGTELRTQPFKLKQDRYRRTVIFFSLLFVRVISWEVALRGVLGEKFVSRGRTQRWRRYAREFRKLATDMGGVMIKLGQFVSSRVDVLPPEITDELQGLQDQVPVVAFEYIKHTVERDLGPL